MNGFKNAEEQKSARDGIKDKLGMTIKGWARINGFSYNTTMNILCREQGLREAVGGEAEKIMTKIREEVLP